MSSQNNLNSYLYFIVAILGVDFIPSFGVIDNSRTQFLYLAVVNLLFICCWTFGDNLNTKHQNRPLKFLKDPISFSLFLFIISCAFSLIDTKNISIGILDLSELILLFTSLILFLNFFKDAKQTAIEKIFLIISISALLQCIVALIGYYNNFGDDWYNNLHKIKGNTGNPNILSASLALKLVFIAFAGIRFTKYKWIFNISFFITSFTILLIGSRTGWIQVFVILLGLIFYVLFIQKSKRCNLRLLYGILAIGLIFFIVNKIFIQSEENFRYAAFNEKIKHLATFDHSAERRLQYWKNAAELGNSHYINGIGLGNYSVESMPLEKEISREMHYSIHAHNDFLEVYANTGLIGLICFSLIFILLFYFNFRIFLKSKGESKFIAYLLFLATLVYLIDSIFNFPMFRPINDVIFLIIAGMSIVNLSNNSNYGYFKLNNRIALGISFLLTIILYLAFTSSKMEKKIFADLSKPAQYRELTGNQIEKRIIFPNININAEPISLWTAEYYYNEGRPKSMFRNLQKAEKINPYTGKVDYYYYLYYNALQKSDSAYYHLKKANEYRYLHPTYYTSLLEEAAKRNDEKTIKAAYNNILKNYTLTAEQFEITLKAAKNVNDKKFFEEIHNRAIKKYPNYPFVEF